MSEHPDFLKSKEAKKSTLVHFFVVAKVGDEYCPLAAVAQLPPSNSYWMNMHLAFVADAAKEIYLWFGSKGTRCGVQAELDAAKDIYCMGRANVPGDLGGEPASRLLTREDRRALKMSPLPSRFPFIAHGLRRCIKERPMRHLFLSRKAVTFWDLVPLGTVLEYDDIRNAAILVDITDLDNIKMCAIDHVSKDDIAKDTMKLVDGTGASAMDQADGMLQDGPVVRGIRSVNDWIAERWKKSPTGPSLTADFPEIPVTSADILKMFWGEAPPPVTEAVPQLIIESSETLIALLKSDTSHGSYVGLVHMCGITADILVGTLADGDIRESVENLAFSTDVFSGPDDKEGFDKVANALRNLPCLKRVYVAEAPEQMLTSEHRANTKDIQEAFKKRTQVLNSADWSSRIMSFSSLYADSVQLYY